MDLFQRQSMRSQLLHFLAVVTAIALGPIIAGCRPAADKPTRHSSQDMPMMRQDGMMQGRMHDMMMDQEMMSSMMGTDADGMMNSDMMQRMMSDPEMMRDMMVIHSLLMNHQRIERQVEEIPGGVRTETVSEDPEIAQAIRTHVRQMKDRMQKGNPIRMMDPVFRELFRNHQKIELQIEDLPGGARVVETSEDPNVVLLIRQHARRAVSEFVDRGMSRAMRPTALPQNYSPPENN